MQSEENAVILTRLLLVISNVLQEICGTAKYSWYQSNLIDCIAPSPCISTEEYKTYMLEMHSLVLLQLGERCFTFL